MEVNQIIHGDCLQVLCTFPSNTVDSVVTDPPYGLSREPDIREVLEKWLAGEDYTHRGSGFMGKTWDSFVPGPSIWREVYRVLKPGSHALVFAGTRTQDLMTVSLRMAGFEIRDVIEWLYFSGFPKSLDVGKQFDKRGGVIANFEEFRDACLEALKKPGKTRSELQRRLGNYMLSHYLTRGSQPAVPVYRDYVVIRDYLELGDRFDAYFKEEAEREKIGKGNAGLAKGESRRNRSHIVGYKETYYITAPATDLAKKWDGWGTALKPAHEPIILVRKPLDGTVADNVERWGTGGLNIDGCRIGTEVLYNNYCKPKQGCMSDSEGSSGGAFSKEGVNIAQGRFPANCVTTEPDAFFSKYFNVTPPELCKKASKRDRNSDWRGEEIGTTNRHPTVKPTDLMAWLVRLITPPGGIVLDPFAGSGSTCVAARREGFFFIGIEQELGYVEIARKRVGEINAMPS
jgi:DNA modification methylase